MCLIAKLWNDNSSFNSKMAESLIQRQYIILKLKMIILCGYISKNKKAYGTIKMSNESGFVAGTLVHTNKGLVPIQNLKVGDLVLSKHENGESEKPINVL